LGTGIKLKTDAFWPHKFVHNTKSITILIKYAKPLSQPGRRNVKGERSTE